MKKRKISQNKFAKNKREKRRIEDNYSALQAQLEQDSRELSNQNIFQMKVLEMEL